MLKRLPEIINHGGVDLKAKVAAYKQEGVKINSLIWDVLYLYLSDDLSVINMDCRGYLKKNEPVSINDVKKLQHYNRKASRILEGTLFPLKNKEYDNQFANVREEAKKLHPGLRDDLSHFVNNAVHKMGFIIDDSADPKFPSTISIENTQRIYDISSQIIAVLEYIRAELQEQRVGF